MSFGTKGDRSCFPDFLQNAMLNESIRQRAQAAQRVRPVARSPEARSLNREASPVEVDTSLEFCLLRWPHIRARSLLTNALGSMNA